MKKIMIALVAMLTMSVSTHAMSYEQARNEALFLTDKMAYELNLTDEQYEAAYEINLDYLMGVTSVDDVYGPYWERRNLDLSYILMEAQWNAFIAASYFYRPLYWDAGVWHFSIYAHYPHRNIFYFSRPVVWSSYRGGHSWRYNGGRSWWADRGPSLRPATHHGMRHHAPHHVGGTHHGAPAPRHDSHSRSGNFGRNASPHYGGHSTGTHGTNTPNSSMRTRESSTRTTVGERPTAPSSGNSHNGSSFGRNSGSSTSSSHVGSRSSFGGHSSHSSMGSSHMGGARSSSSMSGGGHSGGARGGRR